MPLVNGQIIQCKGFCSESGNTKKCCEKCRNKTSEYKNKIIKIFEVKK